MMRIRPVRALALLATLLAGLGLGASIEPFVFGAGSSVGVTLSASGVNPSAVTVTQGGTVTFTNNDSAAHQISSDPHPIHTQCPELNGPVLMRGESFTARLTAKLGTCGYHDHLNPGNRAFQGTVAIVAPGFSDE